MAPDRVSFRAVTGSVVAMDEDFVFMSCLNDEPAMKNEQN